MLIYPEVWESEGINVRIHSDLGQKGVNVRIPGVLEQGKG